MNFSHFAHFISRDSVGVLNRSHKQLIGKLFWIAAIAYAGFAVYQQLRAPEEDRGLAKTVEQVTRYVRERGAVVELADPVERLQVGDPVFLALDDGGFRQVGMVSAFATDDVPNLAARKIELRWYAGEVGPESCQLFQYHSTGRLSEVVETLMPEEKRAQIRERLAVAMAEHGDELSETFIPLVRESLVRMMPVVEAEFGRSIDRHRDEIDALVDRWNDEVVEERLVPLAREEILPIVQKHGREPADAIGKEIWNRASLFRFGWRAIYDKSPLPKRDLVQEEWKRFVRDEAVPVLESHMDEVVVAIQRSVQDIAANEAVRAELGAVAEDLFADPDSRRLMQTVLKETFLENQELRSVWQDVWASKQAEEAFQVAGDRLEPVIRGIGDEIFGSETEGIDPQFARVLRSQILRKDRRWIVAWHTGAGTGILEVAKKRMPYPMVYLAAKDDSPQ